MAGRDPAETSPSKNCEFSNARAMRVSAMMVSPPVRNDLRFIVGLLPFRDSLTLSCEIAVSLSLRGLEEPVSSASIHFADSVPGHNKEGVIPPIPAFDSASVSRSAASSQRRRLWTGSHRATVCTRLLSRSEESPELAARHSILQRVCGPAPFRRATRALLDPNRQGRAA